MCFFGYRKEAMIGDIKAKTYKLSHLIMLIGI